MEMNPMYKMLRLVLRVLLLTLMLQEASAAIPVQQWTQPSGLRVYLVENPAIAMVDLQIDFDAGSRRDPPTQAGLASAESGFNPAEALWVVIRLAELLGWRHDGLPLAEA